MATTKTVDFCRVVYRNLLKMTINLYQESLYSGRSVFCGILLCKEFDQKNNTKTVIDVGTREKGRNQLLNNFGTFEGVLLREK